MLSHIFIRKIVLKLKLKASDFCVIIFDKHGYEITDVDKIYDEIEIKPTWKISMRQDDGFVLFDTTDKLYNNPKYCNIIRYETSISSDKKPIQLCLENVGKLRLFT